MLNGAVHQIAAVVSFVFVGALSEFSSGFNSSTHPGIF
jgi:hypothetical protein